MAEGPHYAMHVLHSITTIILAPFMPALLASQHDWVEFGLRCYNITV